MNYKKKNAYGSTLTHVGIHTGNGITRDSIDWDRVGEINLIEHCNLRKIRNQEGEETYIRVNPNRNCNGYILDEYSKFQEIMQNVFCEIGVNEFVWKRVDLSFNTMDNSYYENYTKLNRLLIACIANSANDTNTYDTKNFWNGKTKSLATKNGYREVEFYDKWDESNHKSPYYGRLELRSKRMRGSIEHEFLDVWFERLDRAMQEFESVQDRFNQNMVEVYMEDLKKKKADRDFLSVTSFLMDKRDYIFTSKQMRNLLVMMGFSEEAAKNKAYNFKKHHSIEYYKKEDLQEIISQIKFKITDYFSK